MILFVLFASTYKLCNIIWKLFEFLLMSISIYFYIFLVNERENSNIVNCFKNSYANIINSSLSYMSSIVVYHIPITQRYKITYFYHQVFIFSEKYQRNKHHLM